MTSWKCAYCGYLNFMTSPTCGQGETHGCGAPRRDANKELGTAVVGWYLGKPVYDSDTRANPDLQMHENFSPALAI